MKVVVTGGTGFIGGKLVEALVREGHQVRCLVRETSDTRRLQELGVELHRGDLGDTDALQSLPQGGDVIYHLAALVSDWGSRGDFYKYNLDATRVLLDACIECGVKRFIHMSSSTVIWMSDFWNVHNLVDVDETFPYREHYNDPYNASKADAERLVLSYNEDRGIETVVIRPSNVWGAGDKVILPRIAKAAKKGILVPMGSGSRIVTPCHVDNLVRALLLVSGNENAPGNIYFINDGIKVEYMEFLTGQLRASGIEWKPGFSIPYKLAYAMAAAMEAIFKLVKSKKPPVLTRFAVAVIAGSRSYSIEKARRELGYAPSVDMAQGLKEMGEWVKEIGGTEVLLSYR